MGDRFASSDLLSNGSSICVRVYAYVCVRVYARVRLYARVRVFVRVLAFSTMIELELSWLLYSL